MKKAAMKALELKKGTPSTRMPFFAPSEPNRLIDCPRITKDYPVTRNMLDFIKNREWHGRNQLVNLLEQEHDDWKERKETFRCYKSLDLDIYFERWEKRNFQNLIEAFTLRMEANKMERTQISCELRNTRDHDLRAASFGAVTAIMRSRAGAREQTTAWRVDEMSSRVYATDSSDDEDDDAENDVNDGHD